MTASSVQNNVRQTIASALSGVAANVYNFVPESVIPPAAVIVPDAPYFEIENIGNSSLRLKVNLVVSALVAYNSNSASLDNLEKLVISILAAMPSGVELSVVEKPTVTQVGASNLLVADIRVTYRYTQTN